MGISSVSSGLSTASASSSVQDDEETYLELLEEARQERAEAAKIETAKTEAAAETAKAQAAKQSQKQSVPAESAQKTSSDPVDEIVLSPEALDYMNAESKN